MTNRTTRYQSKRKGALGALMDLYEGEAESLLETINSMVKKEDWAVIVDKETKDPDCHSIRTICEHLVRSGYGYAELMKKGDDQNYELKRKTISLPSKHDFESNFKDMLTNQANHYEGRWELSDAEIEKIVIKPSWGNIMDPDSLLEHAVVHIMRHHRQVLRFIQLLEQK